MASSSPLPALADITLECTIAPLMLALWTGNGGLTALIFIFFQIVIREGFGVNSPFPYALPNDEFDGRRIMNAIYVIYIIAFSMLGHGLLYLLDLPAMLHMTTLLPKKYLDKCGPRQEKLMFFFAFGWILTLLLGAYLVYK